MSGRTVSVSIIGAGRVGGSLAMALPSPSLWDRDPERCRAISSEVGANPLAMLEEALSSELVIIALPDDALETFASEAAASAPAGKGRIAAHLSAVHGPEILGALARAGFETGKCHPMYPFPSPMTPLPAHVVFGIEGSPPAIDALKRLVEQLLGIVVEIDPSTRALYHLAGVFASNFTMALIGAAEECARAACPTVPPTDLLSPLLEGTLHAWREHGSFGGRTGPWIRGDVKTIRAHREALASFPGPAALYGALSDYLSIAKKQREDGNR